VSLGPLPNKNKGKQRHAAVDHWQRQASTLAHLLRRLDWPELQ
jgi:hypothetical protein